MDSEIVFPASAGMIRKTTNRTATTLSVPRIRGDDPWLDLTLPYGTACSPHPRG